MNEPGGAERGPAGPRAGPSPAPAREAPEKAGRRPATGTEQKLDQYRRRRARALDPAREPGPKRRALARRRIESLLDPGTFVELDMFATARAIELGMEDRHDPGDGVVTGFGSIDGRAVAVYAFEPGVLGGSLGEVTAEKIVKVQELALRDRIPIVGIDDSAGARVHEGVAALAGYADIFYRNVRSSGVVPQVSVVAGPCTGGAVYSPALADFVFVVSGAGGLTSTGPEAMRAAAGDEVGSAELSGDGAGAARSGIAHFLAPDETACWDAVRRLLSFLPSSSGEAPPERPAGDDPERADPELQALVPDGPDLPYDMREVVTRVLDRGDFFEVQPHFAPNLLVGFGRLDGHAVGVVANQPAALGGAIDVDASVKAARFIRFCDAFNLPLVSLVDVPGYVPGAGREHGGIIRHGAQLLYAYAEATVPKLAVVTRRDYGGAYFMMSPKQMGADLNLAWPTAEIAVMAPRAAVEVVHRRELAAAADPAARRRELAADYAARFATPFVAAERGYVDRVIEPRETRRELVHGLRLCLRKTVERPARKHGNIPL